MKGKTLHWKSRWSRDLMNLSFRSSWGRSQFFMRKRMLWRSKSKSKSRSLKMSFRRAWSTSCKMWGAARTTQKTFMILRSAILRKSLKRKIMRSRTSRLLISSKGLACKMASGHLRNKSSTLGNHMPWKFRLSGILSRMTSIARRRGLKMKKISSCPLSTWRSKD